MMALFVFGWARRGMPCNRFKPSSKILLFTDLFIDAHKALQKQDGKTINDQQKKHRLGTVRKSILLEGLNRLHGTPWGPAKDKQGRH